MLPPDPENYRRWHGEGGRRFIWQRERRQHSCPHHQQQPHQQQQWTLHTFHVPREANGPMERRWGQSYREGGEGGTREAGLGQRERKNETHGCFPAVIPKWSVKNTDTQLGHNEVLLVREEEGEEHMRITLTFPKKGRDVSCPVASNSRETSQDPDRQWNICAAPNFRVTKQHQVQTSLCKGDLARLGFLAPHSVDHSWVSECQPSLSWLPHCTLQLSNTRAPGLCGQLLTCCMKHPDMQVKEVTTQTHTATKWGHGQEWDLTKECKSNYSTGLKHSPAIIIPSLHQGNRTPQGSHTHMCAPL